MHIEMLSDHPSAMLADAVSSRQRPAGQETVLKEALRSRDAARADRRWLTWLRLFFTVRREQRELARQRMISEHSTGREESIRAGSGAEQQAADDLGRALGRDWVLFRGYRNRRGEIDGLLLGPGGLFAYEVKYHNATFYIDGDNWQSEKYDRYGNLVGARTPMADRGGRPPSVQIGEPAAMLADWLRKRGHPVTVMPVVLLTHERARIASIQNPTVQVETSVQGLLNLIGQSAAGLSTGQRAEIGQLIRDDHRHHNQRSSTSRPG